MDRYGQYVKAPAGECRKCAVPAESRSRRARPVAPSGEPNITGDWAPEQVVMVDPRGTGGGLVPLSRSATAKPGEPRGGGGGRAEGAAARPRDRGSTAAPS